VEAMTDAAKQATQLANLFENAPEYTSEHSQAYRWSQVLLTNPIYSVLDELEGDSTEEEDPDMVLMLPKSVLQQVQKALQLARETDSDDFNNEKLDEAITEVASNL
jgi:hypothetical protein